MERWAEQMNKKKEVKKTPIQKPVEQPKMKPIEQSNQESKPEEVAIQQQQQ